MSDYPTLSGFTPENAHGIENNVELKKQIHFLETVLNYIDSFDANNQGSFGSFAYKLANEMLVPREALDEITKLYLDGALEKVRSIDLNTESVDKIWSNVNHYGGQPASYYFQYYEQPIIDPEYRRLAEGFLKIQAIRYEAESMNGQASLMYDRLGMKEKTNEMKSKPNDSKRDEKGRTRDDFREDMPLFMGAVREFQSEFIDFPKMDKLTRIRTLQNLRNGVQNKLNELSSRI